MRMKLLWAAYAVITLCTLGVLGQTPAGTRAISAATGLTGATGPTGATIVPTTPPPQILHFIDANGRHHFIQGTSILRVEEAQYPPGSVWVTIASPGWNPVVNIQADIKDITAAWSAATGLGVSPKPIGVPPAPVPIGPLLPPVPSP